jgi:hypothetical protein
MLAMGALPVNSDDEGNEEEDDDDSIALFSLGSSPLLLSVLVQNISGRKDLILGSLLLVDALMETPAMGIVDNDDTIEAWIELDFWWMVLVEGVAPLWLQRFFPISKSLLLLKAGCSASSHV